MTKKLIFSGIQPTGTLHLGNYLGAIRNWVGMQRQASSLFCIVDMHAITIPQDPSTLRAHNLLTAATYIACGIDPKVSSIFIQSHVPEHTELAWILSCMTPLGWLNRMTQFKEKSGKHREQAGLGLYAYPVLMAADILLYHASHVPVGEDQKQHLELTRDIALMFNRTYGQEYFKLPEPIILSDVARIMSLRDGTKKMSKSDPAEASRICLLDSDEVIADTFRRAKTDTEVLSAENLEARPEARNLLGILAALQNKPLAEVAMEWEGKGFSALKVALTEITIATLSPIRIRIHALLKDPAGLQQILTEGAAKAASNAQSTMREVHNLVGLG
jgi:tryptophanyl-tRNA synthetase